MFTRRLLSLFVRAAFCVHSCASAAYPSGSVAAALWTRIRRRTSAPTPRRAPRPAPLFARILSRSHCKPGREDGKERRRCDWPMETQSLFPYARSRSGRLRHQVMRKKIVVRDALFVSKMEDALGLLFGFHLYLQSCTSGRHDPIRKQLLSSYVQPGLGLLYLKATKSLLA